MKFRLNYTLLLPLLVCLVSTIGPAQAATLAPIGWWQLEDTSWNGTANEVKDSSGNNRHGKVIGTPLPASANVSPARTGSPGTCNYGRFPGPAGNGGAMEFAGLPVSTAVGDKTTVAFWMYWDGSNSVMPIGWNVHDLWLVSGRFGFNTGNSDVYGISSAGLANGWHHVVAVFTNGNVTSNKLYIDGVAQALTQRQSSPNNNVAVVSSTLRVGGWQRDTNYRFSGLIDEVKVFPSEIPDVDIASLYTETHVCPAQAVAEWHMDERSWSGLTDEVTDSLGIFNAIGVNGASTSSTAPRAIAGNTGTCGYGVFNGVSHYLAVPSNFPNLTSDFTITAWIKTTRANKSGQRILIDDETNSGGFGFSLGDGGPGRLRFFARRSSPVILDTPNVIQNDQWYFVAAVVDISHGVRHIYVYDNSGSQIAHVSAPFKGWGVDNGAASIGGENNASSEARSGFRFQGNLDEVKVYSGVLDSGELNGLVLATHPCPILPVLLGEYRFEESAWNGSANELKDSSINQRDGLAIGARFPTPASSTPARSANPGTCGYADMPGPASNGGAFSIAGLPVSTAAGGKTSVAFWMYWDGSNSVMPIGWNVHDLWLVNGHFGFNTGNSDIFGISSAGLTNGWHHVVAVFTNGDVASNKIYIDGVAQALTQRLSSPNNSRAMVSSTLRVGGWQADSSYRFSGRIDELQVYDGELTVVDVNTIYSAAHICGSGNVSVTPIGFNCIESSAIPGNGHLYTKVVGIPFGFDVAALKNDGTVETNYAALGNKALTVELGFAADTACNGWAPVNPAVSQVVNFTSADKGRKAVASITMNKAYPNLRCRVTDANQLPVITGCSTDNFSVRPASFNLSSTANADASGTSASATPTLKVGTNFTLTGIASPGYDLGPKLNISQVTAHAGASFVGGLSGVFANADITTGNANGQFSYDEVGYFRFESFGVYDDIFTAVDQAGNDCTADFSNSAVGGQYGCKFGNISPSSYFGRFIPDHLTAQVLSNGSFAHACSSFSYNGQPIRYGNSTHPMLSVLAYNASTPAGLTKNYTGAFARLLPSQFAFTAPTRDAGQKGVDNTNFVQVTATLAAPSLIDNTNGNLTLVLGDDTFTYQRESNALIAPFNNALDITLNSVVDSDGVAANNLPVVLQPAGENIRYGRINLMNAYGSELIDLAVPLQTEYFNGKSFIANADDRCSVATMTITDADTGDALLPVDSCIWDDGSLSGSHKCASTSPLGKSFLQGTSTGFSGSFNLNLKAPGKTGSLTINAAVASWLQFNWQGAGNVNPAAVATFGIYKGNSKQIYLREVY